VWLNISVLLAKPRGSRTPLVVHLLRDVTERRRVEVLARRAMASLQEMAEVGGSAEPPERRAAPLLPHLSKREMQVLRLMACGLSTKEIAENLGVSPVTARNHITHVVSKLGAANRLQAVVYASQQRLI
jgi:DNA-binding NarL/FixJ family response regulator